MIPYFHVERFYFAGASVSSFVALVSLGCLVACAVAVARGKQTGIPVERSEELCLWAIVASYLGARVAPWLLHPSFVRAVWDSPEVLLETGLSSAGGFAGGLLGIVAFFWRRSIPGPERWNYADTVAFALPFGGVLGRLGCALVHDHPGLRSSNWLAVRYPDFPRWDLGLLECLFLVLLAFAFLLSASRPRPPGWFFGVFFLTYGLFRLSTGGLRVDPSRYGGWTIDQYAGTAAAIVGLRVVFRPL